MNTATKKLIVDIETNTAHNTIWLAVTQDVETEEIVCHTSPDTLALLVKEYDSIIGHNLIGFDAPVLRQVWGIGIPKSKAVDTLVMSRLLNPQLDGGHSLKAWGSRLKNDKIEFASEDFDGGLTDEMQEYCIQDVKLTRQLYLWLVSEFDKWKNSETSLLLEHEIAILCRQQEKNGFKLDVPSAQILRAKLSDRMGVIESEMQNLFEPIIEERWSDKTGKRLKDKVTVFNVGSRKQIAERLMSLGWKPEKHTEKGQPIVDETTLEDIDIPQAKVIGEYLMIQKRVGLIDSWLKHVDEKTFRVHGAIITNGAVTGRMTHHSPNMSQVPSVNKPYGVECRSLFIPYEGEVLVGADLSGIELRCLAHYMQDDEWTEELLNGDIHTKNQIAAGLETRAQAKTLAYSVLYGAGPAKVGSIVGGGVHEGQQILTNFLRSTPKLKVLLEKVQRIAEKGYVPGLDGRRVQVRSAHSALNTLLQSCGAIIAKQWCIEAHKEFRKRNIPYKQVAFIHDELQGSVHPDWAEECGEILVSSATKAGNVLGLRCPVAAEYKVGSSWYETH